MPGAAVERLARSMALMNVLVKSRKTTVWAWGYNGYGQLAVQRKVGSSF
jgi:hypothetical protein